MLISNSGEGLKDSAIAHADSLNLALRGWNDLDISAPVLMLGILGFIILILFGIGLIPLVWNGALLSILEEKDTGKLSLARFQALVWTFAIVITFIAMTLDDGVYPEISPTLVSLMVVVGSTFAIGKGVQVAGQNSNKDDYDDRPGMP